jgi:hypothetical protein
MWRTLTIGRLLKIGFKGSVFKRLSQSYSEFTDFIAKKFSVVVILIDLNAEGNIALHALHPILEKKEVL